MYQTGDIVLLPFPFTDLTNRKVRPAIVLSSELINATNDVVLLAITGNLRGDDFSFVLSNEHLEAPMRKQSEVRCHKVFTAEQNIIIKKINALDPLEFRNLFNKHVEVLQA